MTADDSGRKGRRLFEREPTTEQLRRWQETDASLPAPPVAKAVPKRELVKKEPPKATVSNKKDDDSGEFDMSLLDPKFIEVDDSDDNDHEQQWRQRVTDPERVKIVHRPNQSQKAFEITITDSSNKEKSLLVFVKRSNKDPYNKDGNQSVIDDYEKCLVTFAGSDGQVKMAKHLQQSINAALAEKAGKGEFFTEKEKSGRHETEIARYSVAQSYNDTVAATQKALEAYVEALNSNGLVSAVLKDDVKIHAERKSQLDEERLAELITNAFVFDQACLTAANNLQTTAQLPVKIDPLKDLHAITGTGSVKDTVGAATKEKIKILEAVNTVISEEIPARITKAIMAEVNRIRPVIGKRSISEAKVIEIVDDAVKTSIDADQYDQPARGYIDKVVAHLSESLSTYVNNGITEGKAFPREKNEFPSDSKKTQMTL